jgi:hypothetical protein
LKVDEIVIAVKDLQEALKTHGAEEEEAPSAKVQVGMIPVGETLIGLFEELHA